MDALRNFLRAVIGPFARPVVRRLNARFITRSEFEEWKLAYETSRGGGSSRYGALEGRLEQIAQISDLNLQAIHDLAPGSRLNGARAGQLSVGVIVTTCDRPVLLERALHSLRSQTRRPDIIVVVDDGTTDVSSVVGIFSDLNIKLLRSVEPYSGPSAARNAALAHLQTDLVAFLDDDNTMWPSWVERGSSYFVADSEVDIIYGAQIRDIDVSVANRIWFHKSFDYEALKKENYIDLNQLMHRLSKCRFNESLRRLVDWDYVLRLVDPAPERINRVDAIASMYSTAGEDRISVLNWPPELPDVMRHRWQGERLALPDNLHACSCCGFLGSFRPGPNGRANASCPRCQSLERHRFLTLLGPLLYRFWVPETRRNNVSTLVEIAPSDATSAFRRMFTRAVTVDADPQADGRVVDLIASLTDLPLAANSCDAIMVLHVLEHIAEDRKAMREIARVLRPHGLGILQVPMSDNAATDEEVLLSPADRLARYGQADHVRLYGRDYFARLEEEGLSVISVSPEECLPSEIVEKYALLPNQALDFVVRTDARRATELLRTFGQSLRKGAL